MIPHERSLVKKLEGKPFALLGINSDPDRAKLKEDLKKNEMTWRHWWDKTTSGPIATTWNIHGWPTIYVLDGTGKIRYRDVRDQAMENAVETLLKEMETSAAAKPKAD